MGGAEGIVHVGVGEGGQLLGEVGVVLGLTPLPTGVLQHQHGPRLKPLDAPPHLGPDDLRGLVDRAVEQLSQPLRRRPQ